MRKLLQNKRLIGTTSVIVVLLIIGGIFGFRTVASASIFNFFGDAAARGTAVFFSGLIAILVQLIGGLVVNLMYLLLAIAQYNQFLASTAVSTGWVVVRDVVNMFFVVVLLAIAIGTILQQQQYNYSQTLPKFIAAAILVNFSKTICGLCIDFAQIVMMTFVGAFSQAGGGNFAVLIGLNRLLALTVFGSTKLGQTDIQADGMTALSGLILALIFVSLALIVIAIMVAILVIRIIALWFLIILSPAAFFFMALPDDRGYGSKWWDQFINYLLVGPVMAFFLWLSFTIVAVAQGTIADANNIYIATELGINFEDRTFLGAQLADVGQSGISTIGGMAGYILGIGLLIGSLMAAQQLSSVGGSMAGGAVSGFKDYMAGKRGPLNPIRWGRERLTAFGGRLDQRRKEKVERDMIAMGKGVSFIAKAGRGAGQALSRAAMEHPMGQRVKAQAGRLERWSDDVLRVGTRGVLGVGRPFKERMSLDRQEKQEAARKHREVAGRKRNIAQILSRGEGGEADLEAMRIRLEGQIATRQGQGLPVADLQTELADVNNGLGLIQQGGPALAGGVIDYQAQADKELRLAQTAETQATLSSMRMGGNTALNRAGRFFGRSVLGYLSGGLAWVPKLLDDVGKFGEAEGLQANQAELGAIEALSKKLPDDFKTLQAIENGSMEGYDDDPLYRKAATYKIIQDHSGKMEQGEVEAKRKLFRLGGVGDLAREGFERGLLKNGRAFDSHILDEDRLADMIKAGTFKGEHVNLKALMQNDTMARRLVAVLGQLPAKIGAEFYKGVGGDEKAFIAKRLGRDPNNVELDTGISGDPESPMLAIETAGQDRDAAGNFQSQYAKLLKFVAQADTPVLREKFGIQEDGDFDAANPAGLATLRSSFTHIFNPAASDDEKALKPLLLINQGMNYQGEVGTIIAQQIREADLRAMQDMKQKGELTKPQGDNLAALMHFIASGGVAPGTAGPALPIDPIALAYAQKVSRRIV